jgi:hypothetical protein
MPRTTEGVSEVISVGFRSPPPEGSTLQADLEKAMQAAATSATIELMAAYGVVIVPTAALPEIRTAGAGLAALGVVRFTAPGLNGTAILGAATTALRRSNARGTSDRDWIAELANQFIGRFKLKLLRGGFELWSMAPVAISGRLLVTAVSQPGFAPLSFRDSEGGPIAVWIEVEINGPIKIVAPAADAEIPREGDVVLF